MAAAVGGSSSGEGQTRKKQKLGRNRGRPRGSKGGVRHIGDAPAERVKRPRGRPKGKGSQKEKDFAKEECDKIGDWPGCRSLSDASNKFLATAWKQAWEQGECDFEALATRVPGKDAAQLYHMFWQRGWSKKKGKGLREKKQNADVHATKTDTADEGQPSNEAPASASASIRHRSVPLIDKDDLSPHVQEDAQLQQCQQQPMLSP